MKVRVQVIIESDSGAPETITEVASMPRDALQLEELGLTLAEAKAMLAAIQRTMVMAQAQAYVTQQQTCPHCGTPRVCKGQHTRVFRTVFGTVQVPSPRFYTCRCQPLPTGSVSPLAEHLPERSTPELLYLEAKFAALMSYGLTVDLLTDVLPLDQDLNVATVFRDVQQVAERLEQDLGEERPMFIEGCLRDWEQLPKPEGPLTVGLDGGYVHAREAPSRQEGWFEVIVGKSVPTDGSAKCFGFVQSYDTKPKRRLFAVLQSQGMQANQQLTFLSDGGDTVRNLPTYLHPHAEHVLDWFHCTMRITVMQQMAKGLKAQDETAGSLEITDQLDRLKWALWHGNVYKALRKIESLEMDLEAMAESPEQRKLLKAIREFGGYIAANKPFIPNYGDRYRNGETISTAMAESTVNQVISKRFVKKQQMKWTKRGAHLLLQVRTHVLNGDLRDLFCRWYPGMQIGEEPAQQAA
jgi:hypothetical protein